MLSTFLIVLFIVAYMLIAIENSIRVNKAAIALVTGVLSWMLVMMYSPAYEAVIQNLERHVSEISGILFFLLGAMTIVEIIDAHDGFSTVSGWLAAIRSDRLIWVIGFLTFMLSAVLDNLTTSILMVSLLSKVFPPGKLRMLFAGFIVIAANAGGVWSPIGDITTTMLWIGNQVSTFTLIRDLFLPSLVNLLVPMLLLNWVIKRNKLLSAEVKTNVRATLKSPGDSRLILYLGIGILIAVPFFKVIFHLPPFMGILLGLGLMWCLTEILNGRRDPADARKYSVAYSLNNIDTGSILFFLGILLSVSALEVSGVLEQVAHFINRTIPSVNTTLLLTGFLSAIIDNVPLVAAYQSMYPLEHYGTDHSFWHLLAYCSGTGGSILIIGSAAGVVAMGIEEISFFWYLRHIGWMATFGFFAGFLTYLVLH